MQKIVDFVEMCSIDRSLYWKVSSAEGDESFEIQWKSDLERPWRFRKFDHIFWQDCPGKTILSELQQAGVDVPAFVQKLKHTLLQQVAFAQKIVHDAKSVFGQQAVQQAIEDNERFMRQLEDVISKLTKTDAPSAEEPKGLRKPDLKLIT